MALCFTVAERLEVYRFSDDRGKLSRSGVGSHRASSPDTHFVESEWVNNYCVPVESIALVRID